VAAGRRLPRAPGERRETGPRLGRRHRQRRDPRRPDRDGDQDRPRRTSGSDHSEQALTGQLLAQPLEQFLVGACGLIVLGVAISQFWRAASASFMRQYDTAAMRTEERTWARRVGRLGLAARGVVFALIGAFLLMAAWTANPREAAGFASSLDSIANNPSGPWLLALVALGLVAYGLHCFWEARYRRFV